VKTRTDISSLVGRPKEENWGKGGREKACGKRVQRKSNFSIVKREKGDDGTHKRQGKSTLEAKRRGDGVSSFEDTRAWNRKRVKNQGERESGKKKRRGPREETRSKLDSIHHLREVYGESEGRDREKCVGAKGPRGNPSQYC